MTKDAACEAHSRIVGSADFLSKTVSYTSDFFESYAGCRVERL